MVNEAVVAFAATLTVVGTVSADRPDDLVKVTEAPEPGAGVDSVTVQLLLEFDVSAVGLHCKEGTVEVAEATSDTANVCVVLLALAVTVAV
jgi:hypothetical protein